MFSPDRAALVLVDVQQAFHDPAWGHAQQPDCEANDEFAQVMSTDELIGGS
jgi:nicotinamidase-related amidase